MRLRETLQILIDADLPDPIKSEHPIRVANGEQFGRISDLVQLRNAVIQLGRIPALRSYAEPLLTNRAFMDHVGAAFVAPSDLWTVLNEQLRQLIQATRLLRATLTIALPNIEENTVAVSLPAPKSLDALEKYSAELGRFFKISAQIEDGGIQIMPEPTVNAFDTGSFYVELTFYSAAGVIMLGRLSAAAVQVRRKLSEFRAFGLAESFAKAALKDVQSAADFNTQMREVLLAKISEDFKAANLPNANAGMISAIQAAISKNADLLEAGIRFLPPLGFSKKDSASFPKADEYEGLATGDLAKLPEHAGEATGGPDAAEHTKKV